MLKIKNSVDKEKLGQDLKLEYETYDDDREYEFNLTREYGNGNVFFDVDTGEIYGIDVSDLTLLYDLIKADLIEKMEE